MGVAVCGVQWGVGGGDKGTGRTLEVEGCNAAAVGGRRKGLSRAQATHVGSRAPSINSATGLGMAGRCRHIGSQLCGGLTPVAATVHCQPLTVV